MMKPENSGFANPSTTSPCSSDMYPVWKNVLAFNFSKVTDTNAPPAIPQASEIIVRKNNMNTVATSLGVTSLRYGSVPSARIASICSDTFIEPSSLAIPEAFRPETINPVNTGPNSFTIERVTSSPVMFTAPNSFSETAACSASTQPVKNPVSTTIGSEPTPIEHICVKISAVYRGREKMFATERPQSREYSCTEATIVLA